MSAIDLGDDPDGDNTPSYQPCPATPCEHCTGNSAVRKPDGTLLTSWEWCQDVNACAATIDWERLYGR